MFTRLTSRVQLLQPSRFSIMQMNSQQPIIDMDYSQIMNEVKEEAGLEMKGRNSRKPKKANHGARPCSSYMRQLKQKGWYHIVRGE